MGAKPRLRDQLLPSSGQPSRPRSDRRQDGAGIASVLVRSFAPSVLPSTGRQPLQPWRRAMGCLDAHRHFALQHGSVAGHPPAVAVPNAAP